MIASSNNHEEDELRKAIRLREDRREAWKREGERPIWRNLSMIGALGWLIVIPTLLGVLAGRWLDHRFESGIFFSGALIFAGICVGSYLAWNRMNRE